MEWRRCSSSFSASPIVKNCRRLLNAIYQQHQVQLQVYFSFLRIKLLSAVKDQSKFFLQQESNSESIIRYFLQSVYDDLNVCGIIFSKVTKKTFSMCFAGFNPVEKHKESKCKSEFGNTITEVYGSSYTGQFWVLVHGILKSPKDLKVSSAGDSISSSVTNKCWWSINKPLPSFFSWGV